MHPPSASGSDFTLLKLEDPHNEVRRDSHFKPLIKPWASPQRGRRLSTCAGPRRCSASRRNCEVGISLIQWKDTSSHHSVPEAARTQASRRAVSQGWAFTGGRIARLSWSQVRGRLVDDWQRCCETSRVSRIARLVDG